MLILGAGDVERLLDPDALIDALSGAMGDLSAGRASAPNRIAAHVRRSATPSSPRCPHGRRPPPR